MKKLQLVSFILFFVAIAVFLTAAGCARQTSSPASGIDATALAQHLTDTGVKVYGTFWCSACKAQKELFGEAWQYAPYVECSDTNGEELEVCKTEKIEGYPTWVFPDGSHHADVLSLEQLAKLSGFESLPLVPADGS